MSETYIMHIKNLNYFIYSAKDTVPAVDSISYDDTSHTVEIFGTFTENEKTDLDNFMSNYTNPDKINVKRTKMLSTILSQSEEKDWITISNWTEYSSIVNVILTIKLQISPNDSSYQETFRYGVRVMDITNNVCVNEVEFYNSEYEQKEISVSNTTLSLGNLHLELQVKKYNKGTFIYIRKVAVEYV